MTLTATKKMPPEQAKLVASSLPSWAQAVSFLDLVFVELSKRHDWMSVVMVRHPNPQRDGICKNGTLHAGE
jgi:hypothetical protein